MYPTPTSCSRRRRPLSPPAPSRTAPTGPAQRTDHPDLVVNAACSMLTLLRRNRLRRRIDAVLASLGLTGCLRIVWCLTVIWVELGSFLFTFPSCSWPDADIAPVSALDMETFFDAASPELIASSQEPRESGRTRAPRCRHSSPHLHCSAPRGTVDSPSSTYRPRPQKELACRLTLTPGCCYLHGGYSGFMACHAEGG